MTHRFLDGTIYHKRFLPKQHTFKYDFFMIDMDLANLDTLKNSYLSINRFNLFAFNTKDHFGISEDFLTNVEELCGKFNIEGSYNMRFITLPSIFGFVFNPISCLILIEDDKPKIMFAEVHNYNGGRVVYFVELKHLSVNTYEGETKKDMYVSPFFEASGIYKFKLVYTDEKFLLNITLFENDKKMLISTLDTKSLAYDEKTIKKLFLNHKLLTIFVVTRTLWQSLKLKLKGLAWNSVTSKDQIRRY